MKVSTLDPVANDDEALESHGRRKPIKATQSAAM